MSIRESVMDVDEDLAKVNQLYKDLKIHRRKRNYQHKLMRGLKKERDEISQQVKQYVSEIKELKDKRDAYNIMAQEFKSLRDTALQNRDIADKNGNNADFKRFDKEQNKYHLEMMSKTDEAQVYQEKIDSLSPIFDKANKACEAKHKEMLFIREKSQRFHTDLVECIAEIDAIKDRYEIDFIEFEEEE